MHLLFAVLALLLTAAPSERANAACSSIADDRRDCPPPPAVTVGQNLRVEIITRQGEFTYPLPTGDENEGVDYDCPDGKCICTEFVQHLDFKGPVPAFRKANAAEWRAAAARKCSLDNVSVGRDVLRFAVTKHFVSTAIFEIEYCQGCGGSCHGHATLTAYDATSGGTVRLGDAVRTGKLDELKSRLIDAFVASHTDEAHEATPRLLRADLDRVDLSNKGLYVEPGRVFINLDSFALGCVNGSFYPVEIPPEFLRPEFRAKL